MDIEEKRIPRGRFDAFSDGVFAIAVTIMVLELKIPHIDGYVSNQKLTEMLLEQWPTFLAYVISFMVITRLWLSHARLKKEVSEVTTGITNMNLVFLFFIGLLPFPTALLGHGFQTASVLPFCVVIVLASLSLGVLRLMVLTHAKESNKRIKVQKLRIIISLMIGCIGVGIVLAGINSGHDSTLPIIGYVVTVAAPNAYRFGERMIARK